MMSFQPYPPPARPFTLSLDEFAMLPSRPSRRPDLAATPAAAAPTQQPAAPPSLAPVPAPPLGPALLTLRGDELDYAPIEWLWPHRCARGKLTLIGGAPGTGKSTLMMRMAAAVTTGGAWPCGEGTAPQGAVILISPDGDPDTIVPRLRAAGADLAKVRIVRAVNEPGGRRPFDLTKDLELLRETAAGIADLRLIVVDQLPLAAGRTAARENAVLLAQLAALAERCDAAIVAIAPAAGADHLTRRSAPLNALPLAAARVAFRIEIDPADEQRRLILQVKNELAAGPGTLAFRIAAHENEPGEIAARIRFEPHRAEVSATEFTARQSRSFNSAKAEAIEFLRDLIGKASQLRVRHIEHEAHLAGLLRPKQALSQCRALRDARVALGLKVAREGFGKDGAWVWAKPAARAEKQTQVQAAVTQPKSGQSGKSAQVQPAPSAEPAPNAPARPTEISPASQPPMPSTVPAGDAATRPSHTPDLQSVPTSESPALRPAQIRNGDVTTGQN
jgi:hypothetical protein